MLFRLEVDSLAISVGDIEPAVFSFNVSGDLLKEGEGVYDDFFDFDSDLD